MTAVAPARASLLRSSRTMALGTVASRATGFLRTVVIAVAVGDRVLADAYNIANVLPNIIYELLLGGVLTSVVVPLLVAARARDEGDGGEGYAQRLLTLVTVALAAASLLAVLAAPLIARLYGSFQDPEAHDLMVDFSRFFLPQIFFYGVGATIGAILNTRSRFAAPMWSPVLNNLVVIAIGAAFLAERGDDAHGLYLSTAQFLTLALGTTAGIVAQTVALLPSLRASGFRLRLRFDLRRGELATAARLAGWVLVYVAANQLALLVVIRLARAAAAGAGLGYSAYLYAFALFSLPHAIVAVSVITALLPRMSQAAVDRRLDQLRGDLAAGLRLAGVLLVPAAFAFVALGPLIGTLVFGHGTVGVGDAARIGWVLAGFGVGLVPFSAFQLALRAFYALGDTRTPALVNIAVNVVNVLADLLLYVALPPHWRIAGLALGYSASYAAGLALTARALAGRLPNHRPGHVVRTYARLGLAGLLGAALAVAVARAVLAGTGPGPLGAALALAAALPTGAALYAGVGRRLRVPEVRQVLGLVPGLPGRSGS